MTTNALDLCNICDGPGPLNTAGNCNSCDPAIDYSATRDYYDPDTDAPLVCGDCGQPTFYDFVVEDYRHAILRSVGCFLIRPDNEPDDPNHPLANIPGKVWLRTR